MADADVARFERIKVPSAYQMVAEAIEREIMAGRLRPGDEIGTEAELVRQFGVNRSTVREGIRLLEQGGLVQREAGRKLFVCLPQYRNLSTRMSRALVLHQVTFREVYDTAIVLEVASVEAAVDHAGEADIAALEDTQARLELAVGDPIRLAQIDTEFHALLARASGNRVLELAREPAALLFFPTSELIVRRVPQGASRMVAAHRHIIDALKARDKEQAIAWIRRHVADWKKGFERAGRDIDEPVERVVERLSPGGLFS
ncbi:FadR/GntR family transcriptional regulator [Polymorphum gilvum]|uniref:GntR domain protein n=1 Tax=Polymorphum gilvum (strain LMG 25793 / CGMCC 1.9160 / SL003B-26A1) TaxID=991905 RepID=F2J2N3_POLGS|nr:FCD domain-containing protein [Polymorphum gilvum]ADZ70947.1 GntR domain protein [Polymorphum gilvum SL003B-26A1]